MKVAEDTEVGNVHNEGIPFEQVVSDLGFTMDQIRANAKDPAA